MTTPRPDSRLGSDLGPYRIEAVLGRGGMGVVYLAVQTELGRKVALKLLPDDIAHDPDFRARFERESRLAASIDHPNIIPLYEAGEIDGTAYLAMRYVEGTDLASRLQVGPLAPEAAVEILDQVAGALDAAHARGLVHRDVKPGNVLLDTTSREGRDHAYLTDFGLTKQSGSESGLTRAGAFLGTPAYMAPEQIEGRDISGAADQYSLAAMAFEALTGQVPFKRDQDIAVAMAHLKDPVPSASALRAGLPATTDVVVAKGMAKEPSDRYADCAAFVDDLRRAIGGGAVLARPVRDRRLRAIAAAVIGLVLVAVAGIALASGGLGQASAEGPSPSALDSGAQASPTSTDSTPDPSAFPTSAESDLLARLPGEIATTCERGSYTGYGNVRVTTPLPVIVPGTARPAASLACLAAEPGFDLEFRLLRSGAVGALGVEDADAWVSNRVSFYRLKDGDCATSLRAHGRWQLGGADAGAIACTVDDGRAILLWSKGADDLYAVASRSDGDSAALYDWWQTNSLFISP